MTARNLSAQLPRIVDEAIQEHKLVKFAQYWELYQNTTDVQDIEGFFVRTEVQDHTFDYAGGGYCNVAIIADGLLIDIEGDDSDNTGNLTIQPLEFVSGVRVRAGPLQGLGHSREALLVVLVIRVGEEGVASYWAAKNEKEKENLLQFAQLLVKAISEDRP